MWKLAAMVIISKTILNDFSKKHPSSETALSKWYSITKAADWNNFSELKQTFNTTDVVANDRYIFDIKGNQYRLIALIIFKIRTVFILFIGTHNKYDKIDASTIQFTK